jgi:hypothetical protein
MTLDSSGNLGIGVTAPEQKLHIGGNNGIRFGSASSNPKADINYTSAGDEFLDIKIQGTTAGYGNIRFSTGGTPTERARIDSSGNLLVGCTALPNSSIAGFGYSRSSTFLSLSCGSTTSSVPQVYFTNGNGTVGSISTSGSATTYSTSSDYRLKNTVTPMTSALAKIALLKPVTYKWNADGSNGEGFIAHELAEVFPQAVVGEKDAVDANGNPKYQGIDTSFLVATLTAAIQEQQAIITSLTARLDAANL